MGPLGLLIYVLADKEPRPGTHEEFTASLPKQGIGSTIHCVAGDATGIILAAVVTISLGLPMWIDLIVEYMAGFAVGLLIFQSLFMKQMMGGSYWQNVRRTFVPELISMNAMMAGMAPVMSFLMMGRDMRAMQPWEPLFWFVMSLGVIIGFAFAYLPNVWMWQLWKQSGPISNGGFPGELKLRSGNTACGLRRGDQFAIAVLSDHHSWIVCGCIYAGTIHFFLVASFHWPAVIDHCRCDADCSTPTSCVDCAAFCGSVSRDNSYDHQLRCTD